MMDNQKVYLVTGTNKEILIDERSRQLSTFIDISLKANYGKNHVKIYVNSYIEDEIVQHFVDYINYHLIVPPQILKIEPLPYDKKYEEIVTDKFDNEFLARFKFSDLFKIIGCANCMGCESLVNLGSSYTAYLMREMSVDDVKHEVGCT